MRLLKRIIGLILLFILLCFIDESRSNANDYTMPEIVSEPSTAQVLQLDLIDRLSTVVWSETISEAIVIWCMNHSVDYLKCMRDTIGVANAESWIFKKTSSKNNAFGIMERVCGKKGWEKQSCRSQLKSYSSIEESVIDFIKLYEKNKWYKRITWQDWLNWKYCTAGCSNRIPAFNAGSAEFDLSLV